MARRTEERETDKPMSDRDPDGMDSALEGEGDLDRSDDATETSRAHGQHARPSDTTGAQDKASQRRLRRPGADESEDGEDEDFEPSTPRSASRPPPHARRESDRNRAPQSGDRRK
jgi:hypothetical protein